MSLKPTFRPVLLVFFRLLKCYQNGGSFCCDVQLCNRTRRIVIITRRANDVKMRGKINAGLSSNFFFFFFFTFFDNLSSLTVSFTIKEGVQDWFPRINVVKIVKAGVNVKAVFTSLNTAFLPISRSRFKRRQIPMLITLSTIWQFCVNFWVIFRCFGKERFFLKG